MVQVKATIREPNIIALLADQQDIDQAHIKGIIIR